MRASWCRRSWERAHVVGIAPPSRRGARREPTCSIIIAGLMFGSTAHAEGKLAECGDLVVTSDDAGAAITLTIEAERQTGRLEAVRTGDGIRALAITHVHGGHEWTRDLVLVLLDREPRGALVFSGSGSRAQANQRRGTVRWFEGAGCPGPARARLAAKSNSVAAAHTCNASEIARDWKPADHDTVALDPDSGLLACRAYRRALDAELGFAFAVGRFMVERRAHKSTSAADTLSAVPDQAASLFETCVALQDQGISTHGAGMLVWPQFAAGQCFRHLSPVFDFRKEAR